MDTGFCTTSIEFADGGTAVLVIRAKVAEYFGIAGFEPRMQSIRRKPYTYRRYNGLSSELSSEVRVPGHQIIRVPVLNRRSGRKIRVPTESFTPKGCVKTYGITFPVKADHIDIGQWLATNCRLHKPRYFLTEAGRKRPVLDFAYLGWSGEHDVTP